jgi:hypothetical protein
MLDRSFSMDEDVGGGTTTKWAAVSSALTSFVGQSLQGTSVGLQYFPQTDWSAPEGNSCDAAKYAAPEVEIGPLGQTATSIVASINRQTRLSGTPTSAALQGALDHARAWAAAASNASHSVVVVLATDGDPTTCDTDLGRIGAMAAAGVSASPSVRTFVIGVGDLRANLDGLARAGGTTSAFIVDTSGSVGSQFLKALNDIRAKAAGCSYVIPSPPPGQKIDYGQVNVDYQAGGGSVLPFARVASAAACGTRTSAWYYDDAAAPTRIVLCPGACATVEADTAASVQVVVGCSTVLEGEW